jgi:hypothetical protein
MARIIDPQPVFRCEDGKKIPYDEWRTHSRWCRRNVIGEILLVTQWAGIGAIKYETGLFSMKTLSRWSEKETYVRYDTREQARKGHLKMLYEIMGVHILHDEEWRAYSEMGSI